MFKKKKKINRIKGKYLKNNLNCVKILNSVY